MLGPAQSFLLNATLMVIRAMLFHWVPFLPGGPLAKRHHRTGGRWPAHQSLYPDLALICILRFNKYMNVNSFVLKHIGGMTRAQCRFSPYQLRMH